MRKGTSDGDVAPSCWRRRTMGRVLALCQHRIQGFGLEVSSPQRDVNFGERPKVDALCT